MIEDGASVAWGGSESIKESGILDAVRLIKDGLMLSTEAHMLL